MTAAEPARVSAVVIGRNEGVRLVACLASVAPVVDRVVYVDSGSTDGSLAAATAAGATVVSLDMAVPFTAARARNAGVVRLLADGAPPPAYVLFVDGDCTLASGWVPAARSFLDDRPQAAVACGRRRERHPDASVYNRLCDMEWDTPVGDALACGGDSLMRLAAFRAVGGFDGRLIAGEEPELCFRLRREGWTIHRLDAPMTEHDAAMTRFGQWWRRTLRSGWAFAEGAAMHGGSPERYNRRETRSVLIWGGAVPGLALLCGLAALGLALAGSAGWRWFAAAAVVAAALLPAMALRIAWRRWRGGAPWRDAALYGAFVMLGKPAQVLGALRWLAGRLSGGPARLIEYKDPTTAQPRS